MQTSGLADHIDALDPQDLQGIDALLAALRDTWARGDAAAYADLFTPDASYVIYVGGISLGRAAIRRDHEPVLGKWQKGSRMEMRVLDVSPIAPGVVRVLTEGGVGTGKRVPLDKVQTYVLVRGEEGWRCAAFHNTKKNRLFLWLNARATR
jgi:uncharacterized protein (TIGR02246 family)